jgi:hypothetical protein
MRRTAPAPYTIHVTKKGQSPITKVCPNFAALKKHLTKYGGDVWADCLIAHLKIQRGLETRRFFYKLHDN